MMLRIIQGCSVRFFGSKGSIKFVQVLEPSSCLKGSMCNFGKRALGLLPPPSNLLCMFINNYRGKKGAGMGPCHHCKAVKGELSGAVQVLRCLCSLAVEKCVTSLALRPRKLPGLIQITDHISYRTFADPSRCPNFIIIKRNPG
jgi:hypothetical protein